MAKNTFAIIGILAVLLMGLGMVSAVAVDGFKLSINDKGNSTNKISGDNGTVHSFSVTLNHTNDTLGEVYINWSGNVGYFTNITSVENNQSNGTAVSYTFEFTLPASGSSSKTIKANIYNSTDLQKIGESNGKEIYYEVTSTPSPTPSTYNFCEINGTIGDLKIADVTFTNMGEGEDEDWFLLDEIEIEVEVENTHSSENVKDVLVTIMILDSNGNDVTSDFEFDDEEINLNTIKDDNSKLAVFRIKKIPADLDSGKYKVYIKAYSEDAEDEQCVAEAASKYLDKILYQRIEVTREDDPAVVVKQDAFNTVSASCGDKSVALPLSIYNLGSDKEDKVLITLQNGALGINEKIVIDNLKSGKNKEVIFYFDVPQSLSKSTYVLDIVTHYDYDDDEDELKETSYGENSKDDLDKSFSTRLNILSCRGAEPSINANLESVAEIGTNLIVKATITNNGNNNDFVISVSGFEAWADLVSVTPQTASINKGEFTEVIITLSPKVAGTQSFKINAIVDGESYNQSVSVNITERKGLLAGMSDVVKYTIIGIIAVIVLIFLVLIAKISRRPAKPQF